MLASSPAKSSICDASSDCGRTPQNAPARSPASARGSVIRTTPSNGPLKAIDAVSHGSVTGRASSRLAVRDRSHGSA